MAWLGGTQSCGGVSVCQRIANGSLRRHAVSSGRSRGAAGENAVNQRNLPLLAVGCRVGGVSFASGFANGGG